MNTRSTLFLGFSLLASAVAVGEVPSMGFDGFNIRISPRESQLKVNARILPEDPTAHLSKKTVNSDYRFIGWNDENPAAPFKMERSASQDEILDEVTGTYLDGKLMSKQTFEFTENGKPLICTNYVASPDGKSFVYNGHFAYEYDKTGRVISAEKVTVDGSSVRYEYVYKGTDPIFNQQIAYHMDAQGEWMPYQKGEYEYDANYNTIKETYSQWMEGDIQDWMPVLMNDATYDELDRLTSYFPYYWDASASSWVGNNSGAYAGQRFVYTQAGDDALQADYTWENNAWLEYHHYEYTYNDAALLVLMESKYWNRDLQDWSGNDAYGEWGDIQKNSKEEYEYDDYGRVVLCNVFKFKNGSLKNNYRETWSYEALPDNCWKKTYIQGSVLTSTGEFSPYAKTENTYNSYGSETHYISYTSGDNPDEWIPKEEEIRYMMSEGNWFLGGDYYYYVNGERRNSSKERFYYADDFDPNAGYETPYEGRHWVAGNETEDGWRAKSIDQFTWGPREVMTSYLGYNCLSGTPCLESGFEVEYDFSADCSKIFMWPDSNKGDAFYENKTLKSTHHLNGKSDYGVNEWNDAISYEFVYHYTPRSTSNVKSMTPSSDAVEVARYDIMGHRISSSISGLNIIEYSDGTVKKVFCK